MLSRSCTKCQQKKSIENFYRHGSGRYQSWCKQCVANPKFRHTIPDPVKRKIIQKRYYDRHPEKIKLKIGYHRERMRYRKAIGMCTACLNGIALKHESVCLLHWVMILIRTLCTRVKTKLDLQTRKHIAAILLSKIPSICPYTGELLIPGQNLHLDHKIPISQRPDLVLDLDNLQWVSKAYNYCKWDMSDEEFAMKYKLTYIGK